MRTAGLRLRTEWGRGRKARLGCRENYVTLAAPGPRRALAEAGFLQSCQVDVTLVPVLRKLKVAILYGTMWA